MILRHVAWMTALRHALRSKRPWEASDRERTNREWQERIRVPEHLRPLEEDISGYVAPVDGKWVCGKTNSAAHVLALQSREDEGVDLVRRPFAIRDARQGRLLDRPKRPMLPARSRHETVDALLFEGGRGSVGRRFGPGEPVANPAFEHRDLASRERAIGRHLQFSPVAHRRDQPTRAGLPHADDLSALAAAENRRARIQAQT